MHINVCVPLHLCANSFSLAHQKLSNHPVVTILDASISSYIAMLHRYPENMNDARRPYLVCQALGHHPRDSVTHRDAVQGVRYLHGSLLVRDNNELRRLLQLLENGEQAR